jgi:hypothetical protein
VSQKPAVPYGGDLCVTIQKKKQKKKKKAPSVIADNNKRMEFLSWRPRRNYY